MMVRRIEFDPSNEQSRERFYILYQGFVIAGHADPREGPKGMVVVRKEATILRKMQGISEPELNSDGSLTGWRVLTGSLMVLEQPEYELLKKYVDRGGWASVASPKIVDTYDWLDAIPLVEGKVDG